MRLIDADALLEKIAYEKKAAKTTYPKLHFVVSDCIAAIKQAPTIESQVKHGHWIVMAHDNYLNVACSICRERFYVFKKGQYHIEKSNYCPHCGARMDEVSE